MISAIFCRAVAEFHMLGVSAMILISGFSANTPFAAALRRVSTIVPGMPPMKMILPLPVQLLCQPFGRTGASPFLVDADVISARLGHFRIPRDERHAFLAGSANSAIERSRRNRPGDNDIGAGLGHRIDLLQLGLRVTAG